MEKTQNTNNNNGVYDNWREYIPINQVNSSPLPSPRRTAANNNHVVVRPTSLSTQNRPFFHTDMPQNHHNSRLGVPEYYPQNNNPFNYVSENPHTSRLGLPEYYPQNNNFSIYSSENHHNPYSNILESHPQSHTPEADPNSLNNIMERLKICSRSHASSYEPSVCRRPANLLPNEITPPSSACSISNNNVFSHQSSPRRNNYAPDNYIDRFSPSSEHMMRGYPELDAIRAPTKKQQRCLILRSILKKGLSKSEFDDIFSEIMENIGDLMVDSYGHGLIVDLLNKCDARQTGTIVKGLVERNLMIYICFYEYGCKVVQTLFEQLRIRKQTNEIRMICDVLHPITWILINNCNGYHVIKKCLEVFDFEDNWQVATEIGYHAQELVIDKKGIVVLNACIKVAHEELKEGIIHAFDGKTVSYSKHPYGNYVVQCILKTSGPRVIAIVLAQLKGSFVSMAMNKFASNVVQHCFLYGTQEQVVSIIFELTNDPRFKHMIHNEFGNYVAQSALKAAKEPHLIYLLEKILEHKQSLDSHPYGTNLLILARTKAKCFQRLHHERRGYFV